jgi:dihydroflavonol-4-reductase
MSRTSTSFFLTRWPGRRYILGGEDHTFAEVLGLLRAAAGGRPRPAPPLPRWAAVAVAAVAEVRARLVGREPFPSRAHLRLFRRPWYASSAWAGRELGYRFRPLRETLAEAYAWHRAA